MIRKLLIYIKHQHVAILALVIAMSGSAYALTIPRNSVGNRQMRDNAIKSIEVANGTLTKSDLKAGTIPAAPREVYWALIGANGSVIRQKGGVTSTLNTNGDTNAQYRVTIPVATENCSFQATSGDPTPIGSNEFVIPKVMAIAPSTQSTKTVTVQLYAPDPTTLNNWFYYEDSFWFAAYCR
jgi:hypothetical protein